MPITTAWKRYNNKLLYFLTVRTSDNAVFFKVNIKFKLGNMDIDICSYTESTVVQNFLVSNSVALTGY